MVDGWRMLSPCSVPAGTVELWAEQDRENYLRRVQKMWSGGNKMSELGICEQTAERVRGVPVLYKYGGCECQRGEVFLPRASDKSHLSGGSLYKTWDTTVATPHICCCFLCWGTLPSWSYKAVIRTIKLTPSPLAWPPWWYRSEIYIYMPGFLCLTELLLAYNVVIVCSRYGAAQSVTPWFIS